MESRQEGPPHRQLPDTLLNVPSFLPRLTPLPAGIIWKAAGKPAGPAE